MSMFDEATVAHFDTLFELEALPAVIARSAQTCQADIVLGRRENMATEQQEFSIEADTREFFILADDYKPTGSASRPAINDLITVEILGVEITLRVIVLGDGQQTCRNMDLKGKYLRVFSKTF